MKIRGYKPEDLKEISKIWLECNKKAHSFVPEEYFIKHLPMLEELLPTVTVLVSEEEEKVSGFLGMEDGFILGLFVDPDRHRKGIGHLLLQEARKNQDSLTLKAFVKNEKAVAFYIKEGFRSIGTEKDENTGEEEVTFFWEK